MIWCDFGVYSYKLGISSDEVKGAWDQLVLNAWRGEIAGVEVYIVGTAHISAQSAADVEDGNGPA